MEIVFEDHLGVEGRVLGDLTVDYEGRWSDEVESVVDALEAAVEAERDVPGLATVDQELLIQLPERVPVTEIERRTR